MHFPASPICHWVSAEASGGGTNNIPPRRRSACLIHGLNERNLEEDDDSNAGTSANTQGAGKSEPRRKRPEPNIEERPYPGLTRRGTVGDGSAAAVIEGMEDGRDAFGAVMRGEDMRPLAPKLQALFEYLTVGGDHLA